MREQGLGGLVARRWWVGLLALAIVIVVAVGVTVLRNKAVSQGMPATPEVITVTRQTLIREIPVSGSLVFPNTAELTFDVSGKVGEILVSAGQRVTAGQELARLDAVALASLAAAASQASLSVDQATDNLERALKRFATTPVDRAKYEEAVAQARVALKDAQEGLDDFLNDQQEALAVAQWSRADAQVSVDQAEDALADYRQEHSQELAVAQWGQADAEVALDQAQKSLNAFLIDYQKELSAARKTRADAQVALIDAGDAYTDYIRPLGSTQVLDSDASAELERRRLAVELAQVSLDKANDDLAKLEPGPDSLKLQRLRAAVQVAKENLSNAVLAVTRVGETPDSAKLRRLETAVSVARANLVKAEVELARELPGPSQQELVLKQKKVATAQAELDDLLDEPDSYKVAVRRAELEKAQAVLSDAQKDLRGAVIRAPFEGVVVLVNADPDDQVDKDSRIMTVVNPVVVTVEGFIDASYGSYIRRGDIARVTISGLPEEELHGTVAKVAAEPRTERGVVSYPVTIAVALPPGREVPPGLHSVTVVAVSRQENTLLVPRKAVYRNTKHPVVSVLGGDGVLEERPVVLGEINGAWVEVRQGLADGERVVIPASPTVAGG
ncbi:MAG: efflux RND transporter periplasmic adaptor subunit [SAR202 cluster bacterium]|nr:efflux RND transporter periplasmic adaptor subunit [SAR202 cluster bacterium]